MLIASRFTKSTKRPGVATTTCVAIFKRSIWGFIGIPPHTAAMEIVGLWEAKESKLV